MRIKWACLTLLLALASAGWSKDYELVVPSAGARLKNSAALVVFSNDLLKPGDRVVSVRFGGGKPGTHEVRVIGRDSSEGTVLAKGPEVGEFVGKVFLGEGQPPQQAFGASLTEVPPGAAEKVAAAAKADAHESEGVPGWVIWAGAAAGLAFLLLFLKSHFTGRTVPVQSAVGPSRRSSIGEVFSEIQAKLEQLSETQREISANQSGAKDLKKRFDSLEERLAKLESTLRSNAQAAASASEALQKRASELSEKLNNVGEAVASTRKQLESTVTQSAKQHMDLVARAEAESLSSAAAAATATEAVQAAKSAEQRITELAQRLAGSDTKLDNLAKSLAEHAEFARRQAETAGTVVTQLEQLSNGLAALESRTALSPSDIAPLAEGLKDLTDRSQSALAELETRLGDVRSAVELLAERADPTASLDSRLNEISAKFGDVEARIAAMPVPNNDFEPLAGRLDDLSARFQEIESRLSAPAEPTVDLAPLAVRLDELGTRLGEIESKVARPSEASVDLAPVAQRLDEMASSIHEVFERIENLPTHSEELEATSEAVRGLAQRFTELQAQVDSSPDTGPLSERVTELADQLQTLDMRLSAEPEADARSSEEEGQQRPAEEAPPPPAFIIDAASEQEPDSDESDDMEMVAPKGWSGSRGTPEGRASAEFHRGLKLVADDKPNLLHPVDSPLGTAPVGAPVAFGRRLLYTHGQSVRGFWPGREDRNVALPEPIPTDEWRLMQHGSTVFAVGESSVHVGDLNSWARKTSFPGAYFGQTHTDGHWAGAIDKDGAAFIDLRTDRGEPICDPIALEVPGAGLEILASGSSVFAYAAAGQVVRVDGGAAAGVGSFSGTVLRVCRHKDASLALIKRKDGFAVELLMDTGKVVAELSLGFEATPEAFVAMGSRLYLFDKRAKQFVAIDLKKMVEAQRWSSEGVSRVRKLAGIQSARAHFLAVVAACGEKNTGRAFVFDVKSGDEYELCEVLEPFVAIIPVDTHVAIVTRCSYQNIVRVFAPFDSAYLTKAA